MFKSQVITITKKSGNQGNDYKRGLLYLEKHGIILPKCKGVFAKGITSWKNMKFSVRLVTTKKKNQNLSSTKPLRVFIWMFLLLVFE